jgi:hypothetical protein
LPNGTRTQLPRAAEAEEEAQLQVEQLADAHARAALDASPDNSNNSDAPS